jgi:hypothetical protein
MQVLKSPKIYNIKSILLSGSNHSNNTEFVYLAIILDGDLLSSFDICSPQLSAQLVTALN